jgi:hypothetical protein
MGPPAEHNSPRTETRILLHVSTGGRGRKVRNVTQLNVIAHEANAITTRQDSGKYALLTFDVENKQCIASKDASTLRCATDYDNISSATDDDDDNRDYYDNVIV